MPLLLLDNVFFFPKNILEEYELNGLSDGDHSLVPACIFFFNTKITINLMTDEVHVARCF